jgi:hypothetical protein
MFDQSSSSAQAVQGSSAGGWFSSDDSDNNAGPSTTPAAGLKTAGPTSEVGSRTDDGATPTAGSFIDDDETPSVRTRQLPVVEGDDGSPKSKKVTADVKEASPVSPADAERI